METEIEELLNYVTGLGYYVHQKAGDIIQVPTSFDFTGQTEPTEFIEKQCMDYKLSTEPEIHGFENIGLYNPRAEDCVFIYAGGVETYDENFQVNGYENCEYHFANFETHFERQKQGIVCHGISEEIVSSTTDMEIYQTKSESSYGGK